MHFVTVVAEQSLYLFILPHLICCNSAVLHILLLNRINTLHTKLLVDRQLLTLKTFEGTKSAGSTSILMNCHVSKHNVPIPNTFKTIKCIALPYDHYSLPDARRTRKRRMTEIETPRRLRPRPCARRFTVAAPIPHVCALSPVCGARLQNVGTHVSADADTRNTLHKQAKHARIHAATAGCCANTMLLCCYAAARNLRSVCMHMRFQPLIVVCAVG